MSDAPPTPSGDPLVDTLTRLAGFLPRVGGSLTADGPLGRVTVTGAGDTVRLDLAEAPDLERIRSVFGRPPGPGAVADPGGSGGSKREAAARARERTKQAAAALDAAGLTVEVRLGGDPLAVVGRRADPGVITRALGLGRVDLSGRTAFKLARELLG